MKPRNFPGKKYRRKQLALKRAGLPYDSEFLGFYVTDTRFRVGSGNRDIRGFAITLYRSDR